MSLSIIIDHVLTLQSFTFAYRLDANQKSLKCLLIVKLNAATDLLYSRSAFLVGMHFSYSDIKIIRRRPTFHLL